MSTRPTHTAPGDHFGKSRFDFGVVFPDGSVFWTVPSAADASSEATRSSTAPLEFGLSGQVKTAPNSPTIYKIHYHHHSLHFGWQMAIAGLSLLILGGVLVGSRWRPALGGQCPVASAAHQPAEWFVA